MRKLLSTITIVTFIISMIFCLSSCKSKNEVDETEFDSTKLDNTYQPLGAPLENVVIPEEEDSLEMKNLAIDLYDKAIVTGSMSKTYSLAGIRLGWIVANSDIIEKINRS